MGHQSARTSWRSTASCGLVPLTSTPFSQVSRVRIHQAGGPLKLADDTAAACFRSSARPTETTRRSTSRLFKDAIMPEGISGDRKEIL